MSFVKLDVVGGKSAQQRDGPLIVFKFVLRETYEQLDVSWLD